MVESEHRSRFQDCRSEYDRGRSQDYRSEYDRFDAEEPTSQRAPLTLDQEVAGFEPSYLHLKRAQAGDEPPEARTSDLIERAS